jgi:Ricin-type beta-trefoil lectin domain-like
MPEWLSWVKIGFGIPIPGTPITVGLDLPALIRWLNRPNTSTGPYTSTDPDPSTGPYLLSGCDRGLALDTAGGMENQPPILWPLNGGRRQRWYFYRTEGPGECLIVSADNGLALDATESDEWPREPIMWHRNDKSHQRWRLHPTDNEMAVVIESVRTGHVLDILGSAGPESKTPPIMHERHGRLNQQFVITKPAGRLH